VVEVRILDRLRRALLGEEEDPLKREVEEARRLARESLRTCKHLEKHLRGKHWGPLGKPEGRAGLLRAAEELGEVFPEELLKE